jgi:hypothetical protein
LNFVYLISTVLGAATTDDDQELVAQVKNTHAQAATILVKVKCLVVSNKYHVVYAGLVTTLTEIMFLYKNIKM